MIRRLLYSVFVKRRAKEVGDNLHVNGLSVVSKSTILGNNVNFNGIKISGIGNVIIGDNFHSGKDCLLISQNHNYDGGSAIPYDDTYIAKNIIIKDNVWIGDRVIILGGVTIGEGAIVQAGSVVTRDIPDLSIAGGHPAVVFKRRDENHYLKLNQEKSFF